MGPSVQLGPVADQNSLSPTEVSRRRRRLLPRAGGLLAPGDSAVVFGGGAFIVVSIFFFWVFASNVSPDVWVPCIVFVALCIVSVPWIIHHAGSDNRIRNILLLALILKLLFVFPRYAANEYLYRGQSDSGQYDQAGKVLWLNVHEGRGFNLEGAVIHNYSDETETIGKITGAIYLVVGTSKVGGYLTLSWLSWVGLVMFYKSFRVAYPNAPPYLAAGLIFFLPSMLYWPSSLGKDAIMVFLIGGMTLGVSRLVTPSKPFLGLLWLGFFGFAIMSIRPHLLIVGLTGIAVSFLARNANREKRAAGTLSRTILLLALIPLLLLGLTRMDEFFGQSDGNSFSVTGALNKTTEQTSQGGSAFETQPVNNPLDFPVAIVSVIYRPFPFEVSSVPVLISSLEGTLLLLMTVACARWIWRIPQAMRNHPFAGYCGGYVLAFVFAFSNIGNAGILARQRTQMFPVLMILVACAYEEHRAHLQLMSLAPGAEAGDRDTITSDQRLAPLP